MCFLGVFSSEKNRSKCAEADHLLLISFPYSLWFRFPSRVRPLATVCYITASGSKTNSRIVATPSVSLCFGNHYLEDSLAGLVQLWSELHH